MKKVVQMGYRGAVGRVDGVAPQRSTEWLVGFPVNPNVKDGDNHIASLQEKTIQHISCSLIMSLYVDVGNQDLGKNLAPHMMLFADLVE
jgi:hypothetical protein